MELVQYRIFKNCNYAVFSDARPEIQIEKLRNRLDYFSHEKWNVLFLM